MKFEKFKGKSSGSNLGKAMTKLSPYLSMITKSASTFHLGGEEATLTLLSKASLSKDSYVLDVGCGAGHSSAFVAKHFGCKVLGVDISGEAIDNAKTLYLKTPLKKLLTFQKANAIDLPFENQTFDLVLCESVLIFIKNKEKAMLEFKRVLKKEGFIALNEVCAVGKDKQKAIDFFAQKEFDAHICELNFYENLFGTLKLNTILSSMHVMDLKNWLSTSFSLLCSKQGVLGMLELLFMTFTEEKNRKDFLQIFKLGMASPEFLLKNLSCVLLLVKKNKD